MARDKKSATKGKGTGPGASGAAPKKGRRQGPGLLDRLTGLVVVLFVVSSALQYVVGT
ncbi:MAG: hypothetical protein JWN57_650 [Frankiales bacterium]|jgi:hypothetical protein|nr:hypothetical protein [Frankiales bacterium]